MRLFRSFVDMDTINLNLVPKIHLAGRNATHSVSGGTQTVGTRNASKPGNSFKHLLLSPAQFQEPFQVSFAWVSQIAVDSSTRPAAFSR